MLKQALAVGVLAALCAVVPSGAQTQTPSAATVTRAVDGDTVEAQLVDGRVLTVRLIGIDTPRTERPGVPAECGGPEASDAMGQLVEGQQVVLTPDPTQDATDRYGHSLFYVDRYDGVDVGLEMIRRGWAQTYLRDQEFERFPQYEQAEDDATGGVWARCDGEFHRTAEAVRRDSAEAFVKLYYARISSRHFMSAWGMLGERRKAQVRPYRQWKAGFRGSLGASVLSAGARLRGHRAVVGVRLRSRDRDVCGHSIVRQYFRGSVTLAPRLDSWLFVTFHIRKTRGKTPRLSRSDCPAPRRPDPTPPSNPPPNPPPNCQGYDPCLAPGPDVDCEGGTGNGPRYVEGPVSVHGSDPYDLDRDGDGVACE